MNTSEIKYRDIINDIDIAINELKENKIDYTVGYSCIGDFESDWFSYSFGISVGNIFYKHGQI